jgi:hypothetical protein
MQRVSQMRQCRLRGAPNRPGCQADSMEVDVPMYSGEGASQLLLCRSLTPTERDALRCATVIPVGGPRPCPRVTVDVGTIQRCRYRVRLTLVRWSSPDDARTYRTRVLGRERRLRWPSGAFDEVVRTTRLWSGWTRALPGLNVGGEWDSSRVVDKAGEAVLRKLASLRLRASYELLPGRCTSFYGS